MVPASACQCGRLVVAAPAYRIWVCAAANMPPDRDVLFFFLAAAATLLVDSVGKLKVGDFEIELNQLEARVKELAEAARPTTVAEKVSSDSSRVDTESQVSTATTIGFDGIVRKLQREIYVPGLQSVDDPLHGLGVSQKGRQRPRRNRVSLGQLRSRLPYQHHGDCKQDDGAPGGSAGGVLFSPHVSEPCQSRTDRQSARRSNGDFDHSLLARCYPTVRCSRWILLRKLIGPSSRESRGMRSFTRDQIPLRPT